MPTVALATCAEVPELDEDGPALVAALDARGVKGIPAVWDDPSVEWAAVDLVVLRSTWDYAERRGEFLRWVDSLPRVLNSPEVVRWNTDKRYLAELGRVGVSVVPSMFVEPGRKFDPPDVPFVVKPSVSAGGRRAASYAAGDEQAGEHVRSLHEVGATALVQPYLEGIDEAGETALLYVGGRYSHAIRKAALLRGQAAAVEGVLYLEETIEAREPSSAERATADRALAAMPFAPQELLYARVDLVPTDDGPVALEVELTEPSLYLGYAEGAVDRLAHAIAAALRPR
jgi:glutathione synthase/RimK-type ligase-like ATP-grasp enzyme